MSFTVKATSLNRFVDAFGKEAIDAIEMAGHEKLKAAAKKAKTLVPVNSGRLKDAITTKVKRYRRKHDADSYGYGLYVGLGVKSEWTKDEKGDPVNPAMYAHLVEYGTAQSNENKFMRKAIASVGGAEKISKEIESSVRKTLLRLAEYKEPLK